MFYFITVNHMVGFFRKCVGLLKCSLDEVIFANLFKLSSIRLGVKRLDRSNTAPYLIIFSICTVSSLAFSLLPNVKTSYTHVGRAFQSHEI